MSDPEPLNFLNEETQALNPQVMETHTQVDGHHIFKHNPDGSTVEATEEEKNLYVYYKKGILAFEFLLFLFFATFGMGAVALVVSEIELGSGWLVGKTSMIIVLVVFSVVGAVLFACYIWFSRKFVYHGDEQWDDLISNNAALVTMWVVEFGLLCRYFTLGDINNNGADLNFRRVLYIVFGIYGVAALVIIVRAISRHMAMEKTIYISQQSWVGQQPLVQAGSGNTVKSYHYMKPVRSVIFFMVAMWITTLLCIAFSIWFLWDIVGASVVPEFYTIYLTTFIGLGTMFVVLTVVWVCWNMMTEQFHGAFTAHFDVFYAAHAIYIAAFLLMLVGYRYVYWHVPNTQFENPGVTVPALKLAYFNKIATVLFTLLPFLAMGGGKGVCLMATQWPLDFIKWSKWNASN